MASNVSIRGENLTIESVSAEDGGDYQCNVVNAAGNDSDIITVTGKMKLILSTFIN